MKPLLFLTQRIPYPPDKGDKVRSFAILRHLAQMWDIHLGCFIDDPADEVHLPKLREFCADLCCIRLDKRRATLASAAAFWQGGSLSERYFRSPALAAWVDQTLSEQHPQVAFVYSAVMGQYLLDRPAPPRLVVDLVDVDSEKWRQYSDHRIGPMAWVYRRESVTLLRFERRLAAAADAAILVSVPEAELFRAKAPESADKIYAISNGVDHHFFAPDKALADPFIGGGPVVVMTGAMDYWPNIDACHWFIEAILPGLRRQRPDLRFCIVGRNPPEALQRLSGRNGVEVTGRVADVRPYLQHAAAVVAPMRVARGIQNKILEGMAMGKAVVTSPAGLEGIDAEPGRDLLLADRPDHFIASLMAVIEDPELAGTIGDQARRHILEAYDWQDKLRAFQTLLLGDGALGCS
jgi:sugar transferase (PEP-CTERM/EpsH1 system associated)